MKQTATRTRCAVLVLSCCLIEATAALVAGQKAQPLANKEAGKLFDQRIQAYMKLRNDIKDKLPKLPKETTPEQINAYRVSFEEATRAARAGSKPGEIFAPQIATEIRKTLKVHFRGQDRAELRKTIFEAENEKTPVRVNYPYPQSQEFTEMPATLLLKLPQLPKELRYRFVGRNMLLVDRESNVIVDYMVDALP